MVAEAGSGVDLEYLAELYRRGENEFFSEVLRQFPAIYEEITSCREIVAELSQRMSEVRNLEYGAFGKEKQLDFLTRERERLSHKLDSLMDAELPMTAADYVAENGGVQVMTPFNLLMKKRQEELMAAKARDSG